MKLLFSETLLLIFDVLEESLPIDSSIAVTSEAVEEVLSHICEISKVLLVVLKNKIIIL